MVGWLMAIILVLAVLGGLILVKLRADKRQRSPKVVRLGHRRKAVMKESKTGRQVCSLCRKPADRLVFYADEQGKVIGVCRECKPKAEKRKLMEL